jgi:mitogen-activated protein kinase kinase
MGLSILELVQNRFPFPSDLAPVDLIMHITASEVGTRICCTVHVHDIDDRHAFYHVLQPPQLEDEPDLDAPWSDAMKDFIALS